MNFRSRVNHLVGALQPPEEQTRWRLEWEPTMHLEWDGGPVPPGGPVIQLYWPDDVNRDETADTLGDDPDDD